MELKDVFGTMAMVFGIATVLIGLSAQAVKNYKEKRCGNPLILAVLSMGVYLSRAAYAIEIRSFYILIPDIFGILIVGTILIQWLRYKI